MKTIIKNITRFIILSLFILTAGSLVNLSAGYFVKADMMNKNTGNFNMEIFVDYTEDYSPELEKWMSDISYWDSWSVKDYEKELLIQNWMADVLYWEMNKCLSACMKIAEDDIFIENWMSDTSRWITCRSSKCAYIPDQQDAENEIYMNDWMTDTGRWTKGG